MPKIIWHQHGRTAAAGALALTVLAGPGAADEADAKAILTAMSDYMTAQQTFAFDFDATLDVVTTEDQTIGLASSGKVAVQRPDMVHATRRGGFADMEMSYDGATFTLIAHGQEKYAQVAMDGSIDDLVDTLRKDHGVVLPGADLLMTDPAALLMDGVTDVKDLGSGFIGGQECDHIALRNDELDVQIWVAQGDAPHPCRYVISARDVPLQPQYSVQINNWRTDVGADDLSAAIPDGTSEVAIDDLSLLSSELPENFTVGAAK